MSHLGIKKRQGIPIVREGVEALEHKQETPPPASIRKGA